MSYQAKISLANYTPRELTPCKTFHICHCDFKVAGKTFDVIAISELRILKGSNLSKNTFYIHLLC